MGFYRTLVLMVIASVGPIEGKGDEHIEEQLYRFLCNRKWIDMWPSTQVQNITGEGPAHFLILMNIEFYASKSEEKNRTIKFEAYWTKK